MLSLMGYESWDYSRKKIIRLEGGRLGVKESRV